MDKVWRAVSAQDNAAVYRRFVLQGFARYLTGKPVFYADRNHPLYDCLSDMLGVYAKTRHGNIYILSPQDNPMANYPAGLRFYKVGRTRFPVTKRIRELNKAGVLDNLQYVAAYPVAEVCLEGFIHRRLRQICPVHRKEFFCLPFFQIDEAIRLYIRRFDEFCRMTGISWHLPDKADTAPCSEALAGYGGYSCSVL